MLLAVSANKKWGRATRMQDLDFIPNSSDWTGDRSCLRKNNRPYIRHDDAAVNACQLLPMSLRSLPYTVRLVRTFVLSLPLPRFVNGSCPTMDSGSAVVGSVRRRVCKCVPLSFISLRSLLYTGRLACTFTLPLCSLPRSVERSCPIMNSSSAIAGSPRHGMAVNVCQSLALPFEPFLMPPQTSPRSSLFSITSKKSVLLSIDKIQMHTMPHTHLV
ncbi:hypothetical protein F5B22DRAFT_199535 [Xylaria bambusicola]|uniref:uncharacterized protein n=1 Tax=Xylaria bambusicola TaxID=326684 RepID=UPI00200812DA|nr:uncharacterized protein F5B22DRAFT_199535 [Xylaria bambusicola]KAI0515042.1 hypothetical protein F5B22DRAFT_199535 [Xylaria bambusicola]